MSPSVQQMRSFIVENSGDGPAHFGPLNTRFCPSTASSRVSPPARNQRHAPLQFSPSFLRVLIRFLVALLFILAFSLFYTFGLKDTLFNEQHGIVVNALGLSGGRAFFHRARGGSVFTEMLPQMSHSLEKMSHHGAGHASRDWIHASPSRRGLLNVQEDRVERNCENIEQLMHPIDVERKLTSQEKCEFVDAQCDDNMLYKFYYCYIEVPIGHVWLARIIFYLISIYCGLVLFYILADTADAYFSPALLKLSSYLRLPPNLAGVTLLALGSGAPELCSTVAGLVNDNSDLAISVPIGGGVFVVSVVVGAVALVSDVRVSRRPFIRDVGSYLFAVLFVFIVYLDGRVRLFEGLLCFAIYIFYVLLVVIARFVYQKRKKKRLNKKKTMQKKIAKELQVPFLTSEEQQESTELDEKEHELQDMEDEEAIQRGIWFKNPVFNTAKDRSHELKDKDAVFVRGIGFIMNDKKGQITVRNYKEINDRDLMDDSDDIHEEEGETDAPKDVPVINDYFAPNQALDNDDDKEEGFQIRSLLCCGCDLVGFTDMKWHEKISFLLGGWYCQLARNLTIPRSEPEEWNKYFATVSPFCGTMFLVLLTFQLFSLFEKWQWWMLVLWIVPGIIALLFGVLVFLTAERKKAPIYNPILVTFAFVMCMAWIFFAADNLVKFLEVVGSTLTIPPSVLGITILAWGNSIGDMIANVVIARGGYATMAISASYASPLLNALIGLGMSFVFNTTKSFISGTNKNLWSGPCFLTPSDPALTVTFIFLIIILLSSLICVPIMRFRIRKPFACWLFLLYGVYMILALVASLVPAVGDGINKYIRLPTPDEC